MKTHAFGFARRHGRALGIATFVVAVAGLFAAMFAPAASAIEPEEPFSICKDSLTPCESPYSAGTTLTGTSTNFKVHFGKGGIRFQCGEASIGMKTPEQVGFGGVPLELTSFDLSKCNYLGLEPCTVTTTILDPSAEITSSEEGPEFYWAFVQGASVKWHWKCTYQGTEYSTANMYYWPGVAAHLEGGETPALNLDETPGITCEGVCEGEDSLIEDGYFKIASPQPLYLRAGTTVGGTSLCKGESVNGPGFCGTANRYPAETLLTAGLESSTMLSVKTKSPIGVDFTCTESTFTPATTTDIGKTSGGKVIEPLGLEASQSDWTFGDCVRNRSGGKPTPCEMDLSKAGALGISATSGVNGALGFGETVLHYHCPNVPLIGTVDCLLMPESTASVQGGAPAHITMSKLSLKKLEGSSSNCPKVNTVDASYELTGPEPIYVAGESDEY